jgi:hypothetical protein
MTSCQQYPDRFLKIERWAKKRYLTAEKSIVVSIGGKPTRYSRIEDLAFEKLIIGRKPQPSPVPWFSAPVSRRVS